METDAPFLAPGKYRGKRNEPAYVVETAKELAEVKGISQAELAQATTDNFFRLYAKTPRSGAGGMSMRFTILGCGSSGGVPRVGNIWGNCDPANPKNRRRRCALLVERFGKGGATTVLVDTPPDLREQLLDDARRARSTPCSSRTTMPTTRTASTTCAACSSMPGGASTIYADARTRATPDAALRLLLRAAAGLVLSRRSSMRTTSARPQPMRIDGAGGTIEAVPILQEHGDMPSLGFRFGNLAYSPDVGGIPDASLPLLQGLDLWIVDALRPQPHPSHFSVKQALAWIERLAPKRAILTHMTFDLDYDALRRELPPHVEPAYDGMVVHAD